MAKAIKLKTPPKYAAFRLAWEAHCDAKVVKNNKTTKNPYICTGAPRGSD